MLWLLLILGVIGAGFYIVDKRIKEKFKTDDKFNPDDWGLPKSVELSADIRPQVVLPTATAVEKISYEKRDSVLTSNGIFFKALQKAIGNEYQVLTNISAADVLNVVTNNNALVTQVAIKNISDKQFDFILCEKESLAPICVIMLDDDLNSVLVKASESANLTMVRFRTQVEYDVENVKEIILLAVGEGKISLNETPGVAPANVIPDPLDIKPAETISAVKEEMTDNGIDLKLCPNCSAVMLKRKAKNGENAGKFFWLCSTYPICRGMRAV